MIYLRKLKHYMFYFFGLISQNPKLVFTEFLEDYSKDYKSSKIIKDHKLVWICSLPKSGSTLVEEIIDFFPYVKLDRSLNRFYSKGKLAHVHNISKEMLSSAPEKKLSYIKTHTHYNSEILKLINDRVKIIFTFRDLRDVMISRYYHILQDKSHIDHQKISRLGLKEGFIYSFKSLGYGEKNILTYYYNWIKDWQSKKFLFNHLELWFEDFVKDPNEYLKKILMFLNFDDNTYNLSNLKIYLKKKNTYKHNRTFAQKINDKSKNVSTFRSGKIENWKTFFDDEITNEFNKSLPGPLESVIKKL